VAYQGPVEERVDLGDFATVVDEVEVSYPLQPPGAGYPAQPPGIIQTRKFIFPGQQANKLRGKDDTTMRSFAWFENLDFSECNGLNYL
jgi:hypothetical protein